MFRGLRIVSPFRYSFVSKGIAPPFAKWFSEKKVDSVPITTDAPRNIPKAGKSDVGMEKVLGEEEDDLEVEE